MSFPVSSTGVQEVICMTGNLAYDILGKFSLLLAFCINNSIDIQSFHSIVIAVKKGVAHVNDVYILTESLLGEKIVIEFETGLTGNPIGLGILVGFRI